MLQRAAKAEKLTVDELLASAYGSSAYVAELRRETEKIKAFICRLAPGSCRSSQKPSVPRCRWRSALHWEGQPIPGAKSSRRIPASPAHCAAYGTASSQRGMIVHTGFAIAPEARTGTQQVMGGVQ
jgi:hypothetical protein